MLSLSQTTGYAIRALACLPEARDAPRLIAEVAHCTGIPRAYLAKIVNRLVREGLVSARRGHRGGITLARPAERISLLNIVEAVEGPHWLGHCLLGLEECRDQRECPTHEFWMETCQRIREKLAATSLASVIAVYPEQLKCTSGPPAPSRPVPKARAVGAARRGGARVRTPR